MKLEGGLEKLKDVVINDSLGICDELDKQMQHLINTYECEWNNAINDPEKLKRFRHFTNSEEKDKSVQFVQERDQIRPATLEERDFSIKL